MAVRGVSAAEVTPLDRLAYMGTRGTGALEFRPARGPERPSSTALDLAELVETARRAVRGDLATEAHAGAALAHILQVGTSAGGARAKAAIAWHPKTHEIRAGQFDVAAGFEHWLLKFDGMGSDAKLGPGGHYGRVEFAYALMAAEAGIRMSPCRLLEEGGRAHFMTKRFDRDGNVKHHLQTLCAIAHLDYRQRATHDVSEWLSVIDSLGLGYEAKEEALRRTIFNVMARNCDDHTKNVSFLRKHDAAWELAPAYDLTHAYNPRGAWTYQHLTSVNGKFARITRRDILDVADRFAIGTAPRVLAEVRAAVGRWRVFAKRAGLPVRETQRIGGHHQLL
jgi:serine/threonine-protein kinase HipA